MLLPLNYVNIPDRSRSSNIALIDPLLSQIFHRIAELLGKDIVSNLLCTSYYTHRIKKGFLSVFLIGHQLLNGLI